MPPNRPPARGHVILLAFSAVLITRLLSDSPKSQQSAVRNTRVSRIIDGDTVETDSGERLRLLGIDAPELATEGRPGQPHAVESTAWLSRKLLHRTIRIEVPFNSRGRYGRTLTCLFLESELINQTALETGHARLVDDHVLPANLEQRLRAAEARARINRLGVWRQAKTR